MRVLIVDDDQRIRTVVRLGLPDAKVLEAEDGPRALDVMGQERVDLVILDVMMPNMDGLEVLRRIRASAKHADVPVVILTAKTAERDHLLAFRGDADGYVTKPFDIDELDRLVREVTTRSPEERRALRSQELGKAETLSWLERVFEQ